jgi:hypothetical protein
MKKEWFLLGGVVAISATTVFLIIKIRSVSVFSPSSSTEEKVIKVTPGPIQEACTYLPSNTDPYKGNFGYYAPLGDDELDLFKYQGEIVSFSLENLQIDDNDCQYYVVGLERGNMVNQILLPVNFKSLPNGDGKNVLESDGQILQQLKGEVVRINVQFQKEGEKRKFFSWEVEVL